MRQAEAGATRSGTAANERNSQQTWPPLTIRWVLWLHLTSTRPCFS